MGISINGPSGIDTAYIIDSLVALEQNKVTRVENIKKSYKLRIEAYSKLQTFMNDIGSAAKKLKSEDDFNVFTTTSSNEEAVTFDAKTGSVAGSYDLLVFQTAQREKLISADNIITSQSASLSSLGIAPGKFSINDVEITIDDNDTIQDLRLKINTTTDADGNKSGVSAAVIKMADDNFRLILTSEDTKSGGPEYKDLEGGTFLVDMGYIFSADGDKGSTSQVVQSADDINSAFGALAAGDLIEYTGIDQNGSEVTNSFIVTATSTIDDLTAQIENTFHGMVDVTIDGADGTMSITDKNTGKSTLAMNSFVIDGVDYSFNTATIGYSESNMLTEGRDAFFSVDGINIQSEKNTVSEFINGVTLELHKASYEEAITIKMERDYDAITNKAEELFKAYNALVRYIKDSTKYGDPNEDEDEEKKSEKGVISGDMTARMMLNKIRSVFHKDLDITGQSQYSTLSMIGLKTNTQSSEFELDKEKFKDALKTSFEEVIPLFITKGYSENTNIVMGNFSEDTAEGVYMLEEIEADDSYRIQRTNPSSPDWYPSATRNGEVISFDEGPAVGLMLTAPIGSGDGEFIFSKGLAGHLEELVKDLTDANDGTISLRQKSWNKSIDTYNERIVKLEARVESYRLRLVKQFSSMEQVLSQLNSQSMNMMSQLGMYSQQ